MSAADLIEQVIEGNRAASVVAGAIFDFAGYMTTRDKTIEVGASAECSPVVDQIKSWARNRHLDIDNADVPHWQKALERVMDGEDPSTVLDEITTTKMIATYPKPMGIVKKKRGKQ